MTEEINTQTARPQGSPCGFKSRAWRRFVEKFPHLNTQWSKELNRFEDLFVQGVYEIFVAGYMSHPSFGTNRVCLVAKVIDTGVEVAQRPVLHTSFKNASREAGKLKNRYKGDYRVFSCMDEDEDLIRKADVNNAEAHAKRRAQRERDLAQNANALAKYKDILEKVKTDQPIEEELMTAQLAQMLFPNGEYDAKKDSVSLYAKGRWGIVAVDGVRGERESFYDVYLVCYTNTSGKFKQQEPKELINKDELAVALYRQNVPFPTLKRLFDYDWMDFSYLLKQV
jgi:hypothetical protein